MVESKEIKAIQQKYPFLQYDEEKGILFGAIEIDEGDSYEIEISQLERFPSRFPMVKEVGERIPHKLDRHIYLDTLSCCFIVPAREQILLKTQIKSLLNFVDLIVVPYFQNNSYYEINGEYSQGEYSHTFGILEGYFDILGIDEPQKVMDLLLKESNVNFKLRLIDKCYCGSDVKLSKCGKHRKHYKMLRKVGKQQIFKDILGLELLFSSLNLQYQIRQQFLNMIKQKTKNSIMSSSL